MLLKLIVKCFKHLQQVGHLSSFHIRHQYIRSSYVWKELCIRHHIYEAYSLQASIDLKTSVFLPDTIAISKDIYNGKAKFDFESLLIVVRNSGQTDHNNQRIYKYSYSCSDLERRTQIVLRELKGNICMYVYDMIDDLFFIQR